ncbi:MATE family efflux transporter [Amedibacillus dolichus]|uniref:MATE family efflux transporter n=1 Tax=Amedibacillus dolichus TaxID=31971 RepID=UPI002E75B154|nr:MATE family efflux transporter [Amedibacillus dolichus]MEE0383192.1 MATE family efflux transporter [Amedibacillus dolichus]
MEAVKIRTKNPLGYQPIGHLLMRFAIPSVVSMLVNALYNIVDQIFIGTGVGYLGNAATTVSFPLQTIILALGTMIGAGASAYAAIKLGEKREQEAEHTLGNAFFMLVLAGIIIMVVGLVFLEPILYLFGATAKNFAYSQDYASIILLGTVFNLLGIGLSNMARTDGSPNIAMLSMIAGAVLNTILDPIYIFVFHWGVKGAGIATITSQIIGAVILVYYFLKKSTMRLHISQMKIKKTIFVSILSLGFSSCITQTAATIMQVVMNNSLVYYGDLTSTTGDVALSAMGIVLKISMIITSICIGIGIGAQPILGFNKGARQPKRIKETYKKASSIAVLTSIIGWGVCIAIPGVILSLFGSSDPVFSTFAQRAMRIYMLGIFTAGFQITATSYFQATGQPLKASVLSMMRQLILLIPLILILPLFFGLDGILFAGPIADISSGIVVFVFISKEMKKLNAQIALETEEELGVYNDELVM